MGYTFTLTSVIPAAPREVYAAWLDSRKHSAMTGGKAVMSDKVGAAVSAWDGYISGKNLELVPGKKIVQSWRTTQFTGAHQDSIITVTLTPTATGTRLTLEHSNVPEDQTGYEKDGWKDNYFSPMASYFARARRAASASKTAAGVKKAAPPKKKAAARKSAAKATRKSARTSARTSARKTKGRS